MSAQSALVVLIPEAEPLVASFRIRYDPAAAVGMPAHVTLLYPFLAPALITAAIAQDLAVLFAGFPAFSATFRWTGQFPGVLYLAPEPDRPFRRLTELIAEQFPETPPYGGQFGEIIPHLTLAHVADPQALARIAADFQQATQGQLPLHCAVNQVALMDDASGRWELRRRFALGLPGAR